MVSLVVEHDEQMMRTADHLVDMGPGAGEHGGYVVAEGTAKDVMRVKGSVTGQFLSGERRIAIPPRREDENGHFTIRGAAEHNSGRESTSTSPSGSSSPSPASRAPASRRS